MREHPVFYSGLLQLYRNPSNVNMEALTPRDLALWSTAKSKSGGQAEPPSGLGLTLTPGHGIDKTPTPEHGLASRRAHSGSYPMSHGDHSARELTTHASSSVHRPPPTLLDAKGKHQFHTKKILKRRHRHGQYQYLVKWRGYPESEISWEYDIYLRHDCP